MPYLGSSLSFTYKNIPGNELRPLFFFHWLCLIRTSGASTKSRASFPFKVKRRVVLISVFSLSTLASFRIILSQGIAYIIHFTFSDIIQMVWVWWLLNSNTSKISWCMLHNIEQRIDCSTLVTLVSRRSFLLFNLLNHWPAGLRQKTVLHCFMFKTNTAERVYAHLFKTRRIPTRNTHGYL